MENNSEENLIHKIQSGDVSASRLLYSRYVRYLSAIVSRYLNNDEDVKEMDRPEEEVETENIPSDEIHRMIRELPDGYRTIFNLYVIDGKSHKEIATLLHIKESSSASQLHRAKAILAEKIKQYKARYSSSL